MSHVLSPVSSVKLPSCMQPSSELPALGTAQILVLVPWASYLFELDHEALRTGAVYTHGSLYGIMTKQAKAIGTVTRISSFCSCCTRSFILLISTVPAASLRLRATARDHTAWSVARGHV